MTDTARASGEAMPKINRRSFLRTSVAASAAVAVAAPVAAAEPEMTRRDLAVWHMRELERFLFEDGASKAAVMVIGTYDTPDNCKLLGIYPSGRFVDNDGLFAPKGGEA